MRRLSHEEILFWLIVINLILLCIMLIMSILLGKSPDCREMEMSVFPVYVTPPYYWYMPIS